MAQITREEAAIRLDRNEYGSEGSRDLWAEMKAAGLVAVFGASDDLMELQGAIDEEIGAYDGDEAYVTREGLLENKCRNERCPYHEAEQKKATVIKAIWDDGDALWRYETSIPHASFLITEDGEPYCRGIVFALADVPA